ncbi:MAG: hypothetical protein ACOZNI_04115 [Myxococcota bacterium]
MPAPTAQHLDFEPRASDFMELLRDLGHLDDAGVDRLTSLLVAQPRQGHVVTFDEVRRVAAALLFEREAAMRPEQRELLTAEWARLFG